MGFSPWGSTLTTLNHFYYFMDVQYKKAGIAQLVEHRLPKPRVAGSIPVARSNKIKGLGCIS